MDQSHSAPPCSMASRPRCPLIVTSLLWPSHHQPSGNPKAATRIPIFTFRACSFSLGCHSAGLFSTQRPWNSRHKAYATAKWKCLHKFWSKRCIQEAGRVWPLLFSIYLSIPAGPSTSQSWGPPVWACLGDAAWPRLLHAAWQVRADRAGLRHAAANGKCKVCVCTAFVFMLFSCHICAQLDIVAWEMCYFSTEHRKVELEANHRDSGILRIKCDNASNGCGISMRVLLSISFLLIIMYIGPTCPGSNERRARHGFGT